MPTGQHLSPKRIARIKALAAEGLTTAQIARRMGMHRDLVRVHAEITAEYGWAVEARALVSRYLQREELRRVKRAISMAENKAYHEACQCAWWHKGELLVSVPGLAPEARLSSIR